MSEHFSLDLDYNELKNELFLTEKEKNILVLKWVFQKNIL